MELFAISRRGGYLEYKTQYLEKLPIKFFPKEDESKVTDLVEQMLTNQIALQSEREKFLKILRGEHPKLNVTSLLEKWDEHDWQDFINALEKQKIVWKLDKKSEWLDFFDRHRQAAATIRHHIAAIDEAIDNAVFDLYALDPHERNIVRQAVGK